MLCAPVALGAGAVAYFSLRAEPTLWLGLVLLALGAAGFALGPRICAAAGAAFIVALGFVVADLRALAVEAPILERELSTPIMVMAFSVMPAAIVGQWPPTALRDPGHRRAAAVPATGGVTPCGSRCVDEAQHILGARLDGACGARSFPRQGGGDG